MEEKRLQDVSIDIDGVKFRQELPRTTVFTRIPSLPLLPSPSLHTPLLSRVLKTT